MTHLPDLTPKLWGARLERCSSLAPPPPGGVFRASQGRGQPRALVDGAHGVELGRALGAADWLAMTPQAQLVIDAACALGILDAG